MHLFIDESGTFVPGVGRAEAWCVVAAYVVPEAQRRAAEEVLRQLKRREGRVTSREIKLRDVTSESNYLAFLDELAALDGTLYASAVDAHRNSLTAVSQHKAHQVEALLENIPIIHDAHVRSAFQARAERFSRLSPQLYLQVVCQYQLLAAIIRQAVMYYVQRHPATLGRFRWRADQKNSMNSIFDESFRDHAGPMLQSISLKEPAPMLIGADYRHFQRFRFRDGAPAYLKNTYGLEVGDGFNVAMVMHEDFSFVDSAMNVGVQIADLLASGLRRCLRGGFVDNVAAATALGRLLVEAPDGDPPIVLLSLDQGDAVDRHAPAFEAVWRMKHACRPMVRRGRQSARGE